MDFLLFFFHFLLLCGTNAENETENGVVSCNDPTGEKPEMKIRLEKSYFEIYFDAKTADEAKNWEFIDGFYEKIVPEEDLEPKWINDECK